MDLIEGLKYLTTFQCDHPNACGKGAVCNSCWARGWAEDILKSQLAQPKDSADKCELHEYYRNYELHFKYCPECGNKYR